MKTAQDIIQQIADIKKQYEIESPGNAKTQNRVNKQLRFLYECKLYLESNPRTEFIAEMLAESKRKAKVITDGFGTWLHNNAIYNHKNPKTKYATEMGLKKVKAEIATLKYILN